MNDRIGLIPAVPLVRLPRFVRRPLATGLFTMPPKKSSSAPENAPPADTGIENFETALNELEQIIDTLERDELGLEEGLKQFERGVALARDCQRTLQHAEQRVLTLISDSDLLDNDLPDEIAALTTSASADEAEGRE